MASSSSGVSSSGVGCCASHPESRSLPCASRSLHWVRCSCCSSCSVQPRRVRNQGSGAAGGRGGEGGGGGGGGGDGGFPIGALIWLGFIFFFFILPMFGRGRRRRYRRSGIGGAVGDIILWEAGKAIARGLSDDDWGGGGGEAWWAPGSQMHGLRTPGVTCRYDSP